MSRFCATITGDDEQLPWCDCMFCKTKMKKKEKRDEGERERSMAKVNACRCVFGGRSKRGEIHMQRICQTQKQTVCRSGWMVRKITAKIRMHNKKWRNASLAHLNVSGMHSPSSHDDGDSTNHLSLPTRGGIVYINLLPDTDHDASCCYYHHVMLPETWLVNVDPRRTWHENHYCYCSYLSLCRIVLLFWSTRKKGVFAQNAVMYRWWGGYSG